LFVAVAQVFFDEFLQVVGLQDVVFCGGGNIDQCHARFNTVFQVDVLVQIGRRPEVDQLDGGVGTADAVNAAKALNDTHWIPVDIVIDQRVAVLQILAFGNAIGGNQKVNFPLLRHGGHFGALFGAGGKVGQDVIECSLTEGAAVGVCAARDQGQVNAQGIACPVLQRFV